MDVLSLGLFMRNPFHVPHKPALAVILALGAAPGLRAAVTVSLSGPASIVCPVGATLGIVVKVDGAPAGAPVAWFLWEEGVRIPNDARSPLQPLLGLDGMMFRGPEGPGRVFVLQASCAGHLSSPKIIVLQGAVAGGGGPAAPPAEAEPGAAPDVEPGAAPDEQPGAPEGANKRARVEAPDPAGAARPAAPAARPDRRPTLTGLPPGVKAAVAEFTGPNVVREVDRAFHAAAQLASRHLVIKDTVDDGTLLALLRRHPRLTSIRFARCPALTPGGITAALKDHTRLEKVEAPECGAFNEEVALAMATTHPRLVHLALRGEALSETVLASYAGRLKALKVVGRGRGMFPEEALAFCHKLVHLDVKEGGFFLGERLPASLKTLRMKGNDAFTGHHLPPGLVRLIVERCGIFTCSHVPSSLQYLSLVVCPAVTSDRLAAAGRGWPRLTTLHTDVPIGDEALRVFAGTLWTLHLLDGRGLERPHFMAFANLRELRIARCPAFTGANLPSGLRALMVIGCGAFESDRLAVVPLTHLTAAHCPRFTGLGLRNTLLELQIIGASACPPSRLATVLGPRLPLLRELSCLDTGQAGLDPAALFATNPNLRSIRTGGLLSPAVLGRPGIAAAP